MPVTYRAIMPNCYNYNYFCPNCDHRFFTEKFRKHYLKEWSCITCFGCNQVIDLDNVIVRYNLQGGYHPRSIFVKKVNI